MRHAHRIGVGLVVVVASHVLMMAGPVLAGGPLVLHQKKALGWDVTNPIQYRLDPGPLSTTISAAAIKPSVQNAFAFWSNVPTAAIHFQLGGMLSADVDTAAEYLAYESDHTQGNVVILDQTGAIIDAVAGAGNSDFILGWAQPLRRGNGIGRFYSLMNGKLAASVPQFEPTLIHEIGHAIGLDHSQIQPGLANDGNPTNDDAVPIMFPTSTDAEQQNPPIARQLHGDDVAWLSELYPNGTFANSFGYLSGTLVTANGGTPLQGANVVAINVTNGDRLRYSCVSDYLTEGTGAFKIPVPPGEYKIYVEPIRSAFTGGSSVGPYAESAGGESFLVRVKPFVFPSVYNVKPGADTKAGTLKADTL
jgi:hypothetical protein